MLNILGEEWGCRSETYLCFILLSLICTTDNEDGHFFYVKHISDLSKKNQKNHRLTQNLKMVEVRRDFWRSFGPILLLKQGHLKHMAHDHVHTAFEYFWGARLDHLSGWTVPVLSHPLSKKKKKKNISWCSEGTSCISVHGPCPVTGPYWKEPGSAFFAARTANEIDHIQLVSIRTPGPFLPTYFPDDWPPGNSHAQDCYFPSARLYTSPCWTSWVSPFLHPVKVPLDNYFSTGQKNQVRLGSFSKPFLLYFFNLLRKSFTLWWDVFLSEMMWNLMVVRGEVSVSLFYRVAL